MYENVSEDKTDDIEGFVRSLTEALVPFHRDLIQSYELCPRHRRCIQRFCDFWNIDPLTFREHQKAANAALKAELHKRSIMSIKDLPVQFPKFEKRIQPRILQAT